MRAAVKFTSDTWESFKVQLVQEWHIAVRRRYKDDKVREPWKKREVINLAKRLKKSSCKD